MFRLPAVARRAWARAVAVADPVDRAAVEWMKRHGHQIERSLLGLLFLWFGALKVLGYKSATSLIAQTVYFGDPDTMVVILGLWEMTIGACLLHWPLLRIALLLLFIRLPGTFLALVLQHEACFAGNVLVPTIVGQYLIKDLFLFGAATIMGSTMRARHDRAARDAPAPRLTPARRRPPPDDGTGVRSNTPPG